MSANPKQISRLLFFGSDLVSTMTLRQLLSRYSSAAPAIDVVAPPYAKPRTPLAEFHKLCDERKLQVRVFPKADNKEHKKELWTDL